MCSAGFHYRDTFRILPVHHVIVNIPFFSLISRLFSILFFGLWLASHSIFNFSSNHPELFSLLDILNLNFKVCLLMMMYQQFNTSFPYLRLYYSHDNFFNLLRR